MRISTAALSSGTFFVVGPGTVVGLIPWLITHWKFPHPLSSWAIPQVTGALLVCAGLVPVASAFVEFVKAGGTPLPAAPTQRLVVSGFNRYIRNPMYFGLVTAIIGQALLFSSVGLLIYAVVQWIITVAFVHWYEEPALVRQFGAEYEAYRQTVPAWWPRLHPWTPDRHDMPEAQA
jgi:protein-S-isoprenylcysteine O-methyltransferase Ste14